MLPTNITLQQFLNASEKYPQAAQLLLTAAATWDNHEGTVLETMQDELRDAPEYHRVTIEQFNGFIEELNK
jgi:hypothetical protein